MTLKGCRADCDTQNMELFDLAVHYSNFNSIFYKCKNMKTCYTYIFSSI